MSLGLCCTFLLPVFTSFRAAFPSWLETPYFMLWNFTQESSKHPVAGDSTFQPASFHWSPSYRSFSILKEHSGYFWFSHIAWCSSSWSSVLCPREQPGNPFRKLQASFLHGSSFSSHWLSPMKECSWSTYCVPCPLLLEQSRPHNRCSVSMDEGTDQSQHNPDQEVGIE